MSEEKRVRVLYLDLDGTVRKGKDELGRFVNGPEDVELFGGMPAILGKYKYDGWRIVGVSNQGGIALGIVSIENVALAIAKTQQLTSDAFEKILICQHHPNAEDPEYAVCWCRKPRPGLIIEAAHYLKRLHPDEMYPPHLGLMVGDRPEDQGCAENAGLPFKWAKDWRREQGAEL